MTATGSFGPVVISVTDGLRTASTTDKFFTVAGALSISRTPDATTVKGSAYSSQSTASGGSGAGYAYSLAGGTLPDRLTLSSSGTISGTPAAAGTYPSHCQGLEQPAIRTPLRFGLHDAAVS